ncbi:hypothetical protein NT2_09_01070 [Caenibius tardaugens NBRC 16725]|uniref:Uncharacterized protein n=1 Tax=Caenibius tardaugens NBRC 16725 TaxID=1219035 RepID=U2ZYN9_9SPHN|nr:hypothetical protein [Caenibius tardaugens]AZI35409.1 hypothetical protein EGO55_05085 [Caenibius tardaugens NBRC 16725]GAD50499.1 hypothetical protein NT2_09_01070 [Caenibius tardaugens NBRC 16725]
MNKLIRISTAALLAISALGAASMPANAAACRDAHGRFAKCPVSATAPAKTAKTTRASHKVAAKKASPSKQAAAASVKAAPATTKTPAKAPAHKG